MKKILSKSQANLFLQCPFKWKKCYIDNVQSIPSPAQARGIRIHKKVEQYYKDMKPDAELNKFIAFENRRRLRIKSANKDDKKYFYPIFQELKMQNNELGLKGICDAVYVNPQDDGIICIDFKTGKYRPEEFDSYRFELAVYAELLNNSEYIDEKVKYIGILFIDADKLFFEELKQETIDKMHETMNKVRKGIESGNYLPQKNKYCWWCQHKSECSLMK